jgi:magnesium chelatase family protein
VSITIRSAVFDRGVVVPITLEFSASHHGLPGIIFVGSPRSSLIESKARVFSTFRSLKISLPRAKVTINMLPVEVPKQGSSLDLALAVGLLMLHGLIPVYENLAVIGELGLAGEVRPVERLALLTESLLEQADKIITSGQDKHMLMLVREPGKVFLCNHLQEILEDLMGRKPLVALSRELCWWEADFIPEPLEGRISSSLALALKLSLVGGHHLLVYGSPGVGKSHIKSYLVGLLPPLSSEDMRLRMLKHSQAHTRVYSPHTTATIAGLLGGGTPFQAGMLEQADKGILFLDELPEFSSQVLESLRQPLEEEGVTLIRSGRSYFVPSSCTVIATANPCPCGYFGEKKCSCSFARVQQYLHRLSGPLLDRFALQYRVMQNEKQDVALSQLAVEIVEARKYQLTSRPGFPSLVRLYSQDHLRRLDCWPPNGEYALSQRRCLHLARVARTLADIRLSETVSPHDWTQAESLVVQSWA